MGTVTSYFTHSAPVSIQTVSLFFQSTNHLVTLIVDTCYTDDDTKKQTYKLVGTRYQYKQVVVSSEIVQRQLASPSVWLFKYQQIVKISERKKVLLFSTSNMIQENQPPPINPIKQTKRVPHQVYMRANCEKQTGTQTRAADDHE